MCTNYVPGTRVSVREHLDLEPPTFDCPGEVWPGGKGPILIGNFEWRLAMFGMSLLFFNDGKEFRLDYNARSDTAPSSRSSGGPGARRGDFMRTSPEEWYKAAGHLSRDDSISLIKALTILEGCPGFHGGSVAPVVWLLRFVPRAQEDTELINWIISNTENDWLPFGSLDRSGWSIGVAANIAARSWF